MSPFYNFLTVTFMSLSKANKVMTQNHYVIISILCSLFTVINTWHVYRNFINVCYQKVFCSVIPIQHRKLKILKVCVKHLKHEDTANTLETEFTSNLVMREMCLKKLVLYLFNISLWTTILDEEYSNAQTQNGVHFWLGSSIAEISLGSWSEQNMQ